jgi:bla regulator protein BlaR1
MKKIFALALTLGTIAGSALAGQKAHCNGKPMVVADDDVTFANGISTDDLQRLHDRFGKHFAYFEENGRRYVIRQSAVLDRIEKLYRPQADLGRQQGALGQKQAGVGMEQARIGSQQARLGMEQADIARDQARRALEDDKTAKGDGSRRQEELSRQMDQLGRQQETLGAQQEKLGKQQEILGRQQEQLGVSIEQQVRPLLQAAIRSGAAVETR